MTNPELIKTSQDIMNDLGISLIKNNKDKIRDFTKEWYPLDKHETELKETKDSLVLAKEELVKSKVKVAKKKSFFQKVLGSKPDSLEVEKIDTIKVQ
jgi:hypothetical protein